MQRPQALPHGVHGDAEGPQQVEPLRDGGGEAQLGKLVPEAAGVRRVAMDIVAVGRRGPSDLGGGGRGRGRGPRGRVPGAGGYLKLSRRGRNFTK